MARLLSVNVGLPREIEWQGRTVRTGIFKDPVRGRCQARRLNLDGDGQGDLAGHGGVNRAVYVYQMDSYRHWQEQLKRSDFVSGQFGENFTVEGLPDNVVCIGDRFQIGGGIFEVTQPRVTCYRLGIRLNEPQMASLLTASGRPGFYFRVLQEGEVGAGDSIVQVGAATERMTVAEINALLYLPGHDPEKLRRALRIEALSPGWRASLQALLESRASGNAGLIPAVAAHPSVAGFARLRVTALDRESANVVSITLQNSAGGPLPPALPGQYVVLRLQPTAGRPPLFRSYSLSGPSCTERYRISVKIEPHGIGGAYLQEHLRVGDELDVSAPRGSFILAPGDRPVVLLSAGIGATPVLAMLHALAAAHATRPVVWLHAARDGAHHPFAAEVARLMPALVNGRRHVCFSRPRAQDVLGRDFESAGHISQAVLDALALPADAEVYTCGPSRFMADMKALLVSVGVAPQRLHTEIFNGGESMTPGLVHNAARAPHPPPQDTERGPLVSFARSSVTAHWPQTGYQSILELAEACDVPVRWSCRTGVCHNCESGLISGTVAYRPTPLEPPAEGNLLLCCAQP